MLLNNDGIVLREIVKTKGKSTYREISQSTGLTERTILLIASRLIKSGLLVSERKGRRAIKAVPSYVELFISQYEKFINSTIK